MVYDITRKSSFDEIKSYWYQQLRDNAPKKLIIAIAGNKSDLFENEEVDESVAKSFAKVIQMNNNYRKSTLSIKPLALRIQVG
jgi:GTPase SAR1 family protein